MSALRQQMQADMTVRGLAPRTQKAYIDAVAAIARHYHRSPDTLSIAEIEQYLHHLIAERQRSWSTTNQAVCALRFLFHVTLRQPEVALHIPTRRAGSRQPEILSRDEVGRILNAARQPMHRTFLMTAYAAGLRVSEACHLRCADIDSERMMLRVVSGKGNKDRCTLLSPPLLAQLRLYWKYARPQGWLFPKSSRPDQPLDICTAPRSASSTAAKVTPASPSKAASTACVMRLPPICSNPAWTCIASAVCWGTPISPPRPATCT